VNAARAPRATGRVPAPDVARGLMLWVIAVANVTVWIWAAGPTDGPRDRTLGTGADTAQWTADDVVNMAMSMLVDGRGFPLFSFLVGYGVGQIASREAARGTPLPIAQQLLLRRYGWLLLVGALHACLLFPGDIITAYAFGGLFLALLVTASTRTLVVLAGLGAVLMVLYGAAGWAARSPGSVRYPSLVAESPQEWLSLGLAEGIAVVTLAPIQLLGLLPMMLLGLALSRYRVLEDPGPRRARLLGTAVVGIALGLLTGVGTGLLTTDRLEPSPTAGSVLTGVDAVTGAAQGIGYALVLALVCDRVLRPGAGAVALRAREHPALWSLQALGRRSMSGYLAQSVLFTALLPPFALGLGRSLTPTAALLLGSAVWLATLLGAALLERRGLPGPAESLHRRLFLGPARDRGGPPPPASA
jgi:uncharacterized protein